MDIRKYIQTLNCIEATVFFVVVYTSVAIRDSGRVRKKIENSVEQCGIVLEKVILFFLITYPIQFDMK